MKTTKLIAVGIIGAGLTFGGMAQGREEAQVEMKDVPEAAQTTIKEKAGNDQILRIEKFANKRENFTATDHKPVSGFFDVFGGPSLCPKSALA